MKGGSVVKLFDGDSLVDVENRKLRLLFDAVFANFIDDCSFDPAGWRSSFSIDSIHLFITYGDLGKLLNESSKDVGEPFNS